MAPGDKAEGAQPLYRKLLWLTFFRLAIATVLLASTALLTWQAREEPPGASILYGLSLGIYVVSLGFALILRLRRALVALAYAEIVLDVGVAAAVVRLTGGADSVFVFLFLLGVVNGAILLFRPGAVFAAVLGVSAYLATVLARVPHHLRPDAQSVFVHASAFFLTAALAGYLAEQLRSTGERLLASESSLEAITVLHEALVQSVASGLLTVDPKGRVSFLNRAGEHITGLAFDRVVHRPAERWFAAFANEGGRGETDIVNARGEKLHVGYTVSPLLDRGGRSVGRAVIFQDLTQLRAMEDAMKRGERLADLGRLAAGLAHELRNPLASMSGSIELLRANAALPDEDRRLMDIALREAARLNGLVTSFLEFARPRPPARERVDLGALLADTLDVFANDPAAQRARLERQLEPAVVSGDANLLKQVFWNLLVNAAQALDGSGENRIRVRCAREGEGARVEVADTGSGIAPEDLGQIFTPFFTTKEHGSGLGLATVHRIVEAHGGSIEVDSAPGRGSTFVVRLPGPPPAGGGPAA